MPRFQIEGIEEEGEEEGKEEGKEDGKEDGKGKDKKDGKGKKETDKGSGSSKKSKKNKTAENVSSSATTTTTHKKFKTFSEFLCSCGDSWSRMKLHDRFKFYHNVEGKSEEEMKPKMKTVMEYGQLIEIHGTFLI